MNRSKRFGVGRLPLKVRDAFPQAKTVSDSTKGIFVAVRARDRRTAVTNDPSACAMARACQREQQADGAWIGIATSYLLTGSHLTRYRTPQSVAREIVSFDRHQDFAPGVYGLAAVPPSLAHRMGAHQRASGRQTGEKQRRGKRLPQHRTLHIRGRA